MIRKIRVYWILLVMSAMFLPIQAQSRTVGLLDSDTEQVFSGYTLFTARRGGSSYLIDMEGRVINMWPGETGRDAFLMDNGDIIRTISPGDRDMPFAEGTGYGDGKVERLTWDGDLVWEWEIDNPDWFVHHGVEVLPNGNFMLIVWEYKTLDEAVAMGLNPDGMENDTFWPDAVIEVDPTIGEVVWSWHTWDHLIQDFDASKPNYGNPLENPNRVDINYARPLARQDNALGDWMHANAVDYDPESGLIVLSVRDLDELWVIDHNLTTEEAAGPAGDLLFRWGNPEAYGAGNADNRQLFRQHDVQWVPTGYPNAGNIMLFNNRMSDADAGDYSAVIEISPPVDMHSDHGNQANIIWRYQADPVSDFYSPFQSGVQRLPNGNTLIVAAWGGHLFEVTTDGAIVWDYVNPVSGVGITPQGETAEINGPESNEVFRARRYPVDHPAFADRDLTPGQTIEDME